MKDITLHIDGKKIEAKKGMSVLDAALQGGIYIPHLCTHADLNPLGNCRLCVVEIEGREGVSPSCATPAEDGMVVHTGTPQVIRVRHLSMELMLASHPSDCTTCPKYLQCELQSLAQYLGISDTRFRRRTKTFPLNQDNPLFVHDFSRCVLCGRCVRVCQEVRGVGTLSYHRKEVKAFNRTIMETFTGPPPGQLLADADCRFCGACAELCPTGAIRDKDEILKAEGNRQEALIPCRYTCPAQVDVPRYVRFIREGDPAAALAVIRERVPFPAVLGRVCNHSCEERCRRGELNQAVNIKNLKRYAAEKGEKSWKEKIRLNKPTGKRVAVVGSGPAGLTAAYYLSRKGHKVTVLEAYSFPGGMLRVGIPKYRLPREILDAEIEEIREAGVEIKTNAPVARLDDLFEEGYHAVVVAVGTHQGVKLPIPGAELEGVWVNIHFLKEANLDGEVKIGERIVVLGGGNVAFDCARVALRLGAREVHLACLESREAMPADIEEIEQGEEEGIIIHPSCSFQAIRGKNNHVTGVECLQVDSFSFDENGKPSITVVPNSEFLLPADMVIFAIGQRPSLPEGFGLATGRGGLVSVEPETLQADERGIFAAGDVVTGTASVIEAIAAGRRVASSVDRWLGGNGDISEKLVSDGEASASIGRLEKFAYLQRVSPPLTPVEQRSGNFHAVERGYGEEAAFQESRRCLQCDLRLNLARPLFWGDYLHSYKERKGC